MEFSDSDPFPLIDLSRVSYAEQQAHSSAVDQWLGVRTHDVEASLGLKQDRSSAERHWIGLPVQALLTPYTELRFILDRVNPKGLVVDLGAGYGRMGFVMAQHFQNASFLGIEVLGSRVREGAEALARFSSRQDISLVEGDLSKVEAPLASTYFIYDYGSVDAIEKTLNELAEISKSQKITVIGRGGATRNAIEKRHFWLSQVTRPEHFPHFSVYRS